MKKSKNDKCRVLFLVQYLGLSGAELCALRVLEKLNSNRFESKILHYYTAKSEINDRFGYISDRFVFVDRGKSSSFIRWLFNMLVEIKRFRPKVIVSFGPNCAFYGRLLGFLAGVRSFITVMGNASLFSRTYRLADRVFRLCRQIYIGVSHSACEFSEQTLGLRKSKVRMVYNGIDLSEYKPILADEKLYTELGISRNTHIVTCVASLNRYKNHPFLLRAARLVIDREPLCTFLLVGQDADDYSHYGIGSEYKSNKAYLQKLTSELDIDGNIIFAGSRADIPEILSITDVFVMPSWQEGLNVAVIEAMAMEVPVVATSVGGLREVIEDGIVGYLVESNNEKQMAGRILELLKNPQKCVSFGRAGRQRAEKLFTIEQMVRNYEDIILELCKDTSGRGNMRCKA